MATRRFFVIWVFLSGLLAQGCGPSAADKAAAEQQAAGEKLAADRKAEEDRLAAEKKAADDLAAAGQKEIDEEMKRLLGTWELQTKDGDGEKITLRLKIYFDSAPLVVGQDKTDRLWGALSVAESQKSGVIAGDNFTLGVKKRDTSQFLTAWGMPFNSPLMKDAHVELPYVLREGKLVIQAGQVYLPFEPVSIKGDWQRVNSK